MGTVNSPEDKLSASSENASAADERESRNLVLESLDRARTYADTIRIAREIGRHSWTGLPLVSKRVALLASCTLDPLKPYLETLGFSWNLVLRAEVLPYNQYPQEICGSGSRLWDLNPDLTLLAARLEDVAPQLYSAYGSLTSAQRQSQADSYCRTLDGLIEEFRRRSPAPLLVLLPGRPASYELGLSDAGREDSEAAFFNRIRRRVSQIVERHPRVRALDVEEPESRVGLRNFRNSKYESLGGIPFTPAGFHALAELILRHIFAACHLTRKCLVFDLDGTLWDGVAGELGASGIGFSHRARMLQRHAKALARRGVLLAVNSKNDLALVREVFAARGDFDLRLDEFAAIAVNWESKAENLAAIAGELNIGLDSLVFLDDSPQERMEIRLLHPQVIAPALPSEANVERFFQSLPVFESSVVTEEDASRLALYAAERRRTEHRAAFLDTASFLRSLGMRARIFRPTSQDLARLSQLSLRTNQFNTTTRRYDVAALEQLAADSAHRIHAIRTADRFGEQGIVGMAIVDRSGQWHALKSFLLSCRVLARGVEDLFFAWLIGESRRAGAVGLAVEYVASPKNAPVARFLRSWSGLDEQTDGSFRLRFAAEVSPVAPDHIQLEVAHDVRGPDG